MGKIKFASLFSLILFVVYSNLSFANYPFYSDPHDSLSFDGTGEINRIAEDCSFEIVVIGSVEAMVRTKIPSACEGEEESYSWSRKAAKTGDIVKAGEEIVTGSDGYAKLKLSDGSYIIIDKNSKFTPDKNICEELPSSSRLFLGNIFSKIKKLAGGGKFEVMTETRTAVGVRGTEFVVETVSGSDVIKVYEGSVEVRSEAVVGKIESKAEKMEKLAKDFEEGKITLEEYSQKMMEFSNEVQSDSEQLNIVVEAGYQLTVHKDGTITGPNPIGADDERWWEIIP